MHNHNLVFFNFPWSLYPRRVQIFLKEKNLDIDTRNFDPYNSTEWPPKELVKLNPLGKFPVLQVEDKACLTQSLSILHYLERIFPEPCMTGDSDLDFANIMELISLADEANTILGIWNHNASHLFRDREPQSIEAARSGAVWFLKKLDSLELAISGSDFLYGNKASMADCVAMPFVQFLDEFYGVRIPARFSKLNRWYESFKLRPSVPSHDYPSQIIEISRGLEEQSGFTLEELCLELREPLIHQ